MTPQQQIYRALRRKGLERWKARYMATYYGKALNRNEG